VAKTPKETSLPSGRLGRLARMTALGVRTGMGALRGKGTGEAAAERAAEVLGTLRGLAAKMGQMASYVDGIVPEAHRDAYEASLKALRAQAPRSSAEAVRRTLEAELGEPLDRLFETFDDAPFASASIGQVHRARLRDDHPTAPGREVAVKVQHEGIREAVESDLSNAGLLESMAGVAAGRRFDTKGHLAVLRDRFREELDYGLEARRLTQFAELHGGDPHIRVPTLISDRSSDSVLTTTFVTGLDFDEACTADAAARSRWAETLWKFVFKGNLIGGMFNADPHPGNYIFGDDGVVTFLDYGCVQVIPSHQKTHAVAMHRAAMRREETPFADALRLMLRSKPGSLERLAIDYTRQCFEPLFESPYRVTRPWAASLVANMRDMAKAARVTDDAEFFTLPPEMLFMNRLQFGFYSVLARLDVEVDYAAVHARFLEAEG
jgi:predicted unusual protein kinase regulating ubiquinone biosynthesis (AarF/ABC1/UbiB family)